jgi:hypothetical protein
MMEQAETFKIPIQNLLWRMFGKKDKISGIFSPKLILCRAGNTIILFFLPYMQRQVGRFPAGLRVLHH